MSPDYHNHRARTISAIILIVTGYFAYSVADLCAKMLQEHYSVYQVLSVSGSLGAIICGIWLYASHGWRAFFPTDLKLHLLRSIFVTGTAFFMVRALHTLPLADFYGIAFTMPFIVMILAIFLLNEKIGWRRWTATIIGFSGVLVLAGPQFHHIGEGFIFAITGALFASANIITLRKIGHGGPLAMYGFYPFLFIAIFHIVGMIITESYIPFQPSDFGIFVIYAPFIITGMITIAAGFSRAPETSVVAPFHYTQIFWGVGFGWLFFNTLPAATTYVGLAMIISANLYSLWREYWRKHHVVPVEIIHSPSVSP